MRIGRADPPCSSCNEERTPVILFGKTSSFILKRPNSRSGLESVRDARVRSPSTISA